MACNLRCCCGRASCAYLEHNNAALGGLEKDLETAAKLGQALLFRHESYIASSEAERAALTAQISRLESDKSTLERRNADIARENRELLDHLAALNTTVADSDAHIASLAATLAEAQVEVKRLTALAARTEELERQLEAVEVGRVMVLEREVKELAEREGSAVWRWREAEGRVRRMGEEVERIEREARAERERHGELVARMERRRVVEKELELERAAGRLKGAAAVATTVGANKEGNGGGGGGGKNVVSHFVRDILLDNANLQAGIVELRELLQGSNEEVQNLRELVMVHQPVSNTVGGDDDDGQAHQTTPLDEELEWVAGRKQAPQEVHVHHHYHAKFSTKKDKMPLTRRGSKKRAGIGLLTPTPGSPMMMHQRPSSSRHVSQSSPPPAALSQLSQSLSYAPPRKPRWSVQSTTTGSSTMSSLPNSPHSYFDHGNSIFDRIESMSETSRPTSPESSGYATPQFRFAHLNDNASESTLSAPPGLMKGIKSSTSELAMRTIRPADDDTPILMPPMEVGHDPMNPVEDDGIDPLDISIPTEPAPEAGTEEYRSRWDQPSQEAQVDSPLELDEPDREPRQNEALVQPSLRRSTSHESLVSISGMDIHIPKNSTSQLFAISRGSSSTSTTSILPSRGLPSSRPLASIVEVNASSSNLRSASDSASTSSISMLSGLAASKSSFSPQTSTNASGEWQGGFGRLVGGWVRGKWGIAPMALTGSLRAQAAVSPSPKTNPLDGRFTGINQSGAIPGLRAPVRTPSEVHARVVNEGLLRESLAE